MKSSEGDEKPKSAEPVQDDGYETSNSGEPRRKPSSAECSPAPAPAQQPPPPSPPPPEPEYEALMQRPHHYPPHYRPYEPPPQPPPQDHEPYHHFPFPKYGQPDPYGFKREPEAPYDMSQQYNQPKRDDDPLYNGIKRECEDPYSFVEEEAMCAMLGGPQGGGGPLPPHMHHQHHPHDPHQHPHMQMHPQQMMLNQPKKRGRKKKIKDENGMEMKVEPGMEGALVPRPVKERKKHDRFNGMSEEEVSRRTLPDHLAENLDIIIIGINPGLFAAYKGHHYAGPGNHFWKCLYLSGLTREQMSADEDYKLLNFGIGFTNMVARATKGSADLTRREIKEGSAILLEKLQTFRPKVAVFNGKLIYEVFSGKKDFCFGKQPDTITGTNTYMWVMPSSSARCAQLPRAADKVPFYAALKKFRDYLNGLVAHIDDSELVFPDNTSRRPQDELEIRRLTQEPEPGDTIILEDGTEVPLKKKRGRPKKVKLENGETAPPTPRAPRQPRPPPVPGPNGEEPPKKKRGRPKKIRPEEQQFLLQQQQQQQMLQQQQQQQQLPSMQTLQHDQQYMHQESQFGGGALGEPPGGLLYGGGQPPNDAQPYAYQPPNQGNSMEGAMDMVGHGHYASPSHQSNYEPRPVYSPRHGGQYSVSPAPAPAPPAPTYSPRPAGTPQPNQFPGSPAAFSQTSPPRPASYGSPARGSAYSTPARSPLLAGGGGFAPSPRDQYPLNMQYDGKQQACPRPYSRSPGAPPAAPFPAASPVGGGSYQASPAYSAHSSPAPSQHAHAYASPHHFKSGQTPGPSTTPAGGSGGAGALCSDLGGDMSGALSPTSPGCALDFEPPSPASPRPLTPAATNMDDYNKSNSVGSEMSVGAVSGVGSSSSPAFTPGYDPGDPYRMHSPKHYQEQGGQVAGSPQLEQLHQHPSMYSNNFGNRSTPPGVSGVGSPFSSHAAFRPPDHPHTPHTPHTHPGSPGGEYPGAKPKSQDVASKSLSGLESLVDQIPSIAEGPGGPAPPPAGTPGPAGGEQSAPAPPPPLAEYAPALYGPYGAYGGAAAHAAYGNNGYGAGFVGYGSGWGGQLMRPTPGYLSDWQYGYGPGYAPYQPPYYNGYTPPPHPQQYLSPPAALLDLHKGQDGTVPPSVPSVGFGGFC